LAFLEKLSLSPQEISSRDIHELRNLGLSDEDIDDAIEVCILFNIIVRVADALDFHVPSDSEFEKMAGPLLKMGYRI